MTHTDWAYADAIRTVIAHSGEAVLQNEAQTIAMISDLAPQLKREKEMLKQFYRCDSCNLLIATRSMTGAQREAQRKKVAKCVRLLARSPRPMELSSRSA